MGLIHGSLYGLIWVTAADSVFMCSSNAFIDSWVTFGFVVAHTRAFMESMMENGFNWINFKVSGLG